MTSAKSPDAVAARGASEKDELGPRVVSQTSLHRNFPQVPICAELSGADRCVAEGIGVRSPAPVLALCRALIGAGNDPLRPLVAYRRGVMALAVRSIGEGAQFTVEDDRHGRPRLRRWRRREGVARARRSPRANETLRGRRG
jgi:hypothetical protein